MNRAFVSDILNRMYEYITRHEYIVFGLFMLISLARIWTTRYVMSLDGPQHLYNAHVLVELLRGNEFFHEFFRINDVIVGYWTGHFALGFFMMFLPAWLAEKFFLTSYIFGMFFAFRYLIRSIRLGENNLMIYLIFPFIFHNYLLLGYYSFSIGAIFYFWALGYWIRRHKTLDTKSMIIFALLALGVFLSHGLVFLFFGASLFLLFLTESITTLTESKEASRFKHVFSQLWRLILSLSPAIILWIIYIRSVMGLDSTVTQASYSSAELIKFLLRIRQLVGFNHEVESPAYIAIFILLTILCIYLLIMFFRNRKNGEIVRASFLSSRNVWLYIILMFMSFYFFLPDRISAGSLTNRFGLFFFFTLIIFLAGQKYPRALQILSILVLLGATGITQRNQHFILEGLDKEIGELKELSDFMDGGSTVLSLNTTNNWIHDHTQLFVVDDIALVHLNNPQCAGQFPIVWNEHRLPECFTGETPYKPSGSPNIKGKGHRATQVDYITVFYQERFWQDESNRDWQEIISEYYQLVIISSGKRAALYKRKD